MARIPNEEVIFLNGDAINNRVFRTKPLAGQDDIYEIRSVTLTDENINNFLALDFLDFSGADLSGFFSDNINFKITEYRSEYVKGSQKYTIERNGSPISFEKLNLEDAIRQFQMNIFGERRWERDVPLYRKVVNRIHKFMRAIPLYDEDGFPIRDESGNQIIKRERDEVAIKDVYSGSNFFVPLTPGVPYLTRSQYDRYIELISVHNPETGLGDDIYSQKAKAIHYFSSFLNGLTEGDEDYGYISKGSFKNEEKEISNELVNATLENHDIDFRERVYHYEDEIDESGKVINVIQTETEVPSVFRIPSAIYSTNWLRRKYNLETGSVKVIVKPESGLKTASSIFYAKDMPQESLLGINFRSIPLLFHRIKTPGSREKDPRSASLFTQPAKIIEKLDEVIINGLNTKFIEGEISNVSSFSPSRKDDEQKTVFTDEFKVFGNAEFIKKEIDETNLNRRRINNINFI